MTFLVGSDHYSSYIQLPDGSAAQLGTLVRMAHEMSAISIREWNEAAQATRDEWLAKAKAVLEESHPARHPAAAAAPHGPDGGL